MNIGYQATVDYLPELLSINRRFNRKLNATQASDSATGLRLLCRSPKGKFLAQQEISKLPYQFGLLKRLA